MTIPGSTAAAATSAWRASRWRLILIVLDTLNADTGATIKLIFEGLPTPKPFSGIGAGF